MKSDYAIVIIGYNRIDSMLRTFDSVKSADYGDDNVDLIISIDNSGSDDIELAFKGLSWPYGNKVIRSFAENQGLKKHVLSCGDYLNEYEAITVLEDDILVSPSFYYYMKACVDKYSKCEQVAGISLYGFQWNPCANGPFEPRRYDADVYFMQFAQSWGQIWMKKGWFQFKDWYINNKNVFDSGWDGVVPKSVHEWKENSWLKYHIRYCAERGKYFVYPYVSLSTNMGEVGEHAKSLSTRFQVPVLEEVKKNYSLIDFDDKALRYDAFFENENIKIDLDNPRDSAVIDLYGQKLLNSSVRYLLSTQVLDYTIIRSYGLCMRPIEDNIIYNIPGDDIYLYDTYKTARNKISRRKHLINMWNYCTKERFIALNECVVAIDKFLNLIKSIVRK